MSTPQPHPVDIVGHYLNTSRPPEGCTTAQVAQVIAAWNSIAGPIIEAEKAKAQAAAKPAPMLPPAAPAKGSRK